MALCDSGVEQGAADASTGRMNIAVSPDLWAQSVELKGTHCLAYGVLNHITPFCINLKL